jgi:hypothetical protein
VVVDRWRYATMLIVAAATLVAAREAYSHPLHTTLTEVTVGDDGRMQVVLRAFVDDFAAAISRTPAVAPAATRTPPDSAAARYLDATLIVVDGSGSRLPLHVAGIRRTNDLVWVTLRASDSRATRGVRLTNRVLFERFDDQVNIVQANIGGRRHTVLFTRREGATAKTIAP